MEENYNVVPYSIHYLDRVNINEVTLVVVSTNETRSDKEITELFNNMLQTNGQILVNIVDAKTLAMKNLFYHYIVGYLNEGFEEKSELEVSNITLN
ncbi:hypothetical protein ACSVDA_14230 [Cytobacillus sp. Hm23]